MASGYSGLRPAVGANRGIGWNRSLPAPFGFENAFKGDGANDRIVASLLNPLSFSICSIEFWIDYTTTGGIFTAYNESGTVVFDADFFSTGLRMPVDTGAVALPPVGKHHLVMVVNYPNNTVSRYIDAVFQSTVALPRAYSPVTQFSIGHRQGTFSTNPIDEFRIYNKQLSASEISLNYNYGLGNNPFSTEYLELWYKFNLFETLDFSLLQDGSDMRLGVRDFSGKFRHGQPFNCDTNPASGTYVLKPF